MNCQTFLKHLANSDPQHIRCRRPRPRSMSQSRQVQHIIDNERVDDVLKQVARVRRHGFKVDDSTPRPSRQSSHDKRTTTSTTEDDFQYTRRAPIFLRRFSSKSNANNSEDREGSSEQSKFSAFFKRKASIILSRTEKKAKKKQCGTGMSAETNPKGFAKSLECSASRGNERHSRRYTSCNSKNTIVTDDSRRSNDSSYHSLHMSVLEFQLEALILELQNDRNPKGREKCNNAPRAQSCGSQINGTRHGRNYQKMPPTPRRSQSDSHRTFQTCFRRMPSESSVLHHPPPPRLRRFSRPVCHGNKKCNIEGNIHGDLVGTLKRTEIEELD